MFRCREPISSPHTSTHEVPLLCGDSRAFQVSTIVQGRPTECRRSSEPASSILDEPVAQKARKIRVSSRLTLIDLTHDCLIVLLAFLILSDTSLEPHTASRTVSHPYATCSRNLYFIAYMRLLVYNPGTRGGAYVRHCFGRG